MKSLIAVLVALLLPLQLSWAVAATYCQHETSVQGAQHFGHHTHVHKDARHDQQPAGIKLAADLDCSFCHAASVTALPDMGGMALAVEPASAPLMMGDPRMKAPPERTPDRPQWPRLA